MDESRKQFEEWFENYTGCDPKYKIYANMVEMHWQCVAGIAISYRD